MKPTAPLALALCLTLPSSAFSQQAASSSGTQPFTDPANLRGERVSPTNGHELPIDQGPTGLAQLLRKLNTRASILNIVAHPDDEDGGMLTLYARGFGARVADLSLTRGEGGQNFVTGDFEDALGLIRTQELLANDRYTGVSQLFGTEVDFGFSKTKEEAFAKWTHDRVLYDAVRAIRLVRPLVITATFIGNVTDGHGQHQVSGEIAQEAFKAAADPSVFPEMIAEGLLPWQALKIYARVPFADINSKGVFDYATGQYVPARFTNYVTGKVTTAKPAADVTVPEGSNDPLLTVAAANPSDIPAALAAKPTEPLSYIQFGRIGLSLQRSQISKNMTLPVAGFFNSGYTLYGSVLCNAPTTARPSSLTPKNCHPEQAQRAEGPSTKPAPSLTSAAFNHRPAPTARFITAQGNALGQPHEVSSRAESPIQNSALTTQPNFFTGIDTSIEGIATLAPQLSMAARAILRDIGYSISLASSAFEATHSPNSQQNEVSTDVVANPLAMALKDTDALISGIETSQLPPDQKSNVLHELRIKRVQLNDALVLSLGLKLDASVITPNIVERTSPDITASLTESAHMDLQFKNLDLWEPDEGKGQSQFSSVTPKFSESNPIRQTYQVAADYIATITQPYFFRDNIEQPVYQLRDPALRSAPQTPAPITAWATISYNGSDIFLARIVHDGPQPISIIPPVSIASAPTATVLPTNQTTAQLTATLGTDATTSANINVQSPHNWSIEAKAAGPNSVNFFLHPTAPITGPQTFHVTAQTPDHHTYSEGYRAVGYPGLILTNYYTPATTRVVPVDLKIPEHVRIAYLPGTGDAVPEALASIGLTPTLITVADITPAKLANFDTVILGVRAYTANPDLHGAPTQALLGFARTGGNVLVQYETSGLTSADAPYPLSLGSAEKVVDETDPVQLLTPSNPLLTTPNQITAADFNGWVEERGHGFLSTWDPKYTALTDTHDPGGAVTPAQLPQRGGLITVTVGKGRWTYCAFALYRQLPEAVPGAFRLFVNLITPTR
ncbi:MAG TPA: PIG-L family deacetylase [Acidobacteriaceae bacterium]|nr:PIG-L family deacetylase [Acidobacteriaceae bacterium]